MRVIGLDPGLRFTGWGIVDSDGSRLRHVANGTLASDDSLDVPTRLVQLRAGLLEVLAAHRPEEAAVEATLVNKNPSSTLKLGIARGVILVTPAEAGLPVAEYLPMVVKKAVVGTGHADKAQVAHMVARLLPGQDIASQDAADALAVAICHCHRAATDRRWAAAELAGGAGR
jgi:crossover junction endodeoxyribonuclease RuvC